MIDRAGRGNPARPAQGLRDPKTGIPAEANSPHWNAVKLNGR
jgi:hypothetical protein